MNTIHELLCHRQGGEPEAFAKRAIESLVKKLKDRPDDLAALKTGRNTSGVLIDESQTISRQRSVGGGVVRRTARSQNPMDGEDG